MKPRILPVLLAALTLPAMAQNRVNIKPGETLELKTNEPETQVGWFVRDIYALESIRQGKKPVISAEEALFAKDAMVKNLVKNLKGPVKVVPDLVDIQDLGSRKILTPAQVTTIRKAILLARYVRNVEPKEED